MSGDNKIHKKRSTLRGKGSWLLHFHSCLLQTSPSVGGFIFANICRYLHFADICRYLQISANICKYMHFADICKFKPPLDGFWYLQTGSFLPISTILTCRLDMGRGWILMDWPRSSDCPRFLLIFSQMIFSDCPRFLSFIFTNDLGRLFHLVF